MRTRMRVTLLALAATSAWFTAEAVSNPGPPESVAPDAADTDSVYDACGYAALINVTTRQLIQGFRHSLVASFPADQPLPAAAIGRMDEIARTTLNERALRQPLDDHFAAIAPVHRRAAIEWCRSELGQQLQETSAADLLGAESEKFEAFMKANADAPIRRRQLIDELSRSMAAADREMKRTLHVLSAVVALSMGIADPNSKPDADLLARMSRNHGPRIEALRDQMEVVVQQQMLYLYRDISDVQLRAVIDFVTSDSGRALLDAENRGLQEGMIAALTAFVAELTRAVRAPADAAERET